jgi:hypothetical protein
MENFCAFSWLNVCGCGYVALGLFVVSPSLVIFPLLLMIAGEKDHVCETCGGGL